MAAVRNNIPVIKVKMGPNWSMDIPAMKAAAAEAAKKGIAIVYFVNPNNPTSTIADTNALFDWIRGKPANTVSSLTRPMPNLWRISLTAQLPNLFAKVSTTSLC